MSASILPPTVGHGGSLFTEDGGFDDRAAEHFLATYWQKHPVLFRAAFKFESPISPDELAGRVRAPAHVPARAPPHCDSTLSSPHTAALRRACRRPRVDAGRVCRKTPPP